MDESTHVNIAIILSIEAWSAKARQRFKQLRRPELKGPRAKVPRAKVLREQARRVKQRAKQVTSDEKSLHSWSKGLMKGWS